MLSPQRVAVKQSGTLFYLHTDPLSSISVTTNQSQVVKGTLNYHPFGEIRASTGDVKTDYAFTGQRLETTDGLLYYGARDYDAKIGRFIQPDPIIPYLYNPQSLNRYNYARNNPLRYTDPTGYAETDPGYSSWTPPEPPPPPPSQPPQGDQTPPASTGGDQQPSGEILCLIGGCGGYDPSGSQTPPAAGPPPAPSPSATPSVELTPSGTPPPITPIAPSTEAQPSIVWPDFTKVSGIGLTRDIMGLVGSLGPQFIVGGFASGQPELVAGGLGLSYANYVATHQSIEDIKRQVASGEMQGDVGARRIVILEIGALPIPYISTGAQALNLYLDILPAFGP